MLITGTALHFFEVVMLWRTYGISPTLNDYVFGTYLMGLGAAMIALSDHPHLRIKGLGKAGALTLGVYVIHPIFAEIFKVIDDNIDSPLWDIGYVAVVYFISLSATVLISKNSMLRKLVM
jgi:surface polysaccharide O-acyltransferase-like enzyme